MAELEALKRQISTATDLQGVVKTMKGLAAVSIRQYEKAVESLIDYSRAIEMGLHVVLRNKPESSVGDWKKSGNYRLAAVIFGTEQGMCGQFNEQIANFTMDKMEESGFPTERRHIVSIGSRLIGRLEDRGQRVQHSFALPGSLSAINPLVQELLVHMQSWIADKGIHGVWLFYNHHERGGTFYPHCLPLLPLDRQWLQRLKSLEWPSKVLPAQGQSSEKLFPALVRQYLYVSVFRAMAESLASENASRLAAMQAAEKNIDERLSELHAGFHQQRQMTITEELLDIVGGFEALKKV